MFKIINSITISLLLTITFLSAQVRFDLRFTDPDGVGFHNPNNEWMIKAVQEGADILGNSIKQNAFVTIEVVSKEDKDTYAYSNSVLKEIQSFDAKKITIAMDKILSEDAKFKGIWEGRICFNTNRFSQYDTLRRVAIHELTHTLGFTGLVPNPNDIDNYKSYTEFDQLMVDNEGKHLIVDTGWFWNNFNYNSDFNFSSDIFACGPNIKKRNDEKCMKLYNPSTFDPGSSFFHLDTTTYPRNLLNHLDHSNDYPLWNKYEIGIMEDLGYQIDWDNYCQFVDNMVQSITLTINMEALKGSNCYFKLNKNHKDFPEECASTDIFDGNFSAEFANGYLLQFFLNDHIVHEFNSIKDLKAFKNIRIIDKDYRIISRLKDNVMHLTFKEIKPMENADNNPVKPKPIVKKPQPAKNKKKVAKKPSKKIDRKKRVKNKN